MASTHPKLTAAINEIMADAPQPAEWGVAVLDAQTFRVIAGVNPYMRAEALSISKLATAILFNRRAAKNSIAPDIQLYIQESDVRAGGYLGRLVGQRMGLPRILQTMLHVSDTTGQRALTRFLGGPETGNRALLSQSLESPGGGRITLAATKYIPAEGETGTTAKFYTGHTTPTEAAALLGAASQSPMTREALTRNIFGFGLTRDLPGNAQPNAAFTEALAQAQNPAIPPGELPLATLKNPSWRSEYPTMMGIDEDQRHSVAIIGDFLVAALSKGFEPTLAESPAHPAHDVQAALGQVIFGHA